MPKDLMILVFTASLLDVQHGMYSVKITNRHFCLLWCLST